MKNRLNIRFKFSVKRMIIFTLLINSLLFAFVYSFYFKIQNNLNDISKNFSQEIDRHIIRNTRIINQINELYPALDLYNNQNLKNEINKLKISDGFIIDLKDYYKGVAFGSIYNMNGKSDYLEYQREIILSYHIQEIFQRLYENDGSVTTLFYFGIKHNVSSIFPNAEIIDIKEMTKGQDIASFMNKVRGNYYDFYSKHQESPLKGYQYFWTKPYLDNLGHGMMITLVTPVYINKFFHAFIGSDLTLHYLKKEIVSKLKLNDFLDIQLLFNNDIIIDTFKNNYKKPFYSIEKSIHALNSLSINGEFKIKCFINIKNTVIHYIYYFIALFSFAFLLSFLKISAEGWSLYKNEN